MAHALPPAANDSRSPSVIGYQCSGTKHTGLMFAAAPFATYPLDPEAAAGDPLQWCCGACMSSLIHGGCEPACCTVWVAMGLKFIVMQFKSQVYISFILVLTFV